MMFIDYFSKSLAGWTFVFNDYYEVALTRYLNSPYLDKLAQMVDPYGRTSNIPYSILM